MSILDQLLAVGCVPNIAAYNSENVKILTGKDAGRTFLANSLEIEQDIMFEGELGADPRSKRVLRFTEPIPNLNSQDRIQTEDGKVWTALSRPGTSYLTVDFELSEIASCDV